MPAKSPMLHPRTETFTPHFMDGDLVQGRQVGENVRRILRTGVPMYKTRRRKEIYVPTYYLGIDTGRGTCLRLRECGINVCKTDKLASTHFFPSLSRQVPAFGHFFFLEEARKPVEALFGTSRP